MVMNFKTESVLLNEGYSLIIGIDEAGRGPLAGPVVAAAASFRYLDGNLPSRIKGHKLLNLIRDSKTLSEKQREGLFDFIQENFHVGIGICDHATIDRINILQATYLAMKSAVFQLKSKCLQKDEKCIILVDGNKKIPNLSIEQKTIVSGDQLVKSISAASVIAKVTRDRLMRDMDKLYPGYGFCDHKGYGTRRHIGMLQQLGPCEIHRKSFFPVTDMIK